MTDPVWSVRAGRALATFFVVGAIVVAGNTAKTAWREGGARQVELDLADLRLERALRAAEAGLQQAPEAPRLLLLAAEAAARLHRRETALQYYRSIPQDHSLAGSLALLGQARELAALGRAAAAERAYRNVLDGMSSDHESLREFAVLLHSEGRSWESLPYVHRLIRQRRFLADELCMAGNSELFVADHSEWVQTCLASDPENLLVRLGEARVLILKNREQEAREILGRIVRSNGQNAEAQGRWGRLQVDLGDQACDDWLQSVARGYDDHPEIWYARGAIALRRQQLQAAARCFWETVSRHPGHAEAAYQLSRTLSLLRHNDVAALFAEHSRRLSKVNNLVGEMRTIRDPRMARECVELLLQLGRSLEAAGWCELTLRFTPDEAWARETLWRLSNGRLEGLPLPAALSAAVRRLGLEEWEPPRPHGTSHRVAAPDVIACPTNVRFEDVAPEVGIAIPYYNAAEAGKGLQHIFETTGGGVAALDYDLDDAPDLYLANSCNWRADAGDPAHPDRLFRNRGGERFEDVTVPSGLGDPLFTQGVTYGDFDQDGMPDLYIGNLGRNRLYRNNGDGTFSDATDSANASAGNDWTTSVALVDLNEDNWPDLYVVNYLKWDEVAARDCKHEGVPRSCAPTMFSGTPDRLFLNRGDGTFKDVTDRAGLQVADGKGLGLVVADFDGDGHLSLFVGNDTTANFFFEPEPLGKDGVPTFREIGQAVGLAFDESGRPQATMGIACDDANADGRPDLFATNFYADANSMYFQMAPNVFEDATRRAYLRDASFYMLGFGAQFLDAELDGRPDLIVTNGHVDRTFATGEPDLMPPQFFSNRGTGRFCEADRSVTGPYFQEQMLGRGLAVLDWNDDGREDAVVTHLDRPLALLENRSAEPGHWIKVRLVGRSRDREAIGATVTVVSENGTRTRQLTAGDGYLVANERHLVFGLGAANRVQELRVRWRDGDEAVHRDLPVDRTWIFVEGRKPVDRPR
ncbi:FG-GAP-like repeat-containing protein [Planctellipticum variicoloris]|uniref:FG-GAP-like repeat-containing protein n=1 Tax=Planctellipticum variicoloris TaxID=3064265 RepID=UPI0030135DDA|nr:FG-GAP-like repeat-containing protein [Planctomycetaceae bacterium SH412]